MNEATLLFFIGLTLMFLIVLWISIGISVVYRKRRKKRLELIESTFADIVSRYLYNDPSNPISLQDIRERLKEVGITWYNRRNIQFLIRLMIRTQRSILGENYRKLRTLYSQIPPYRASINKISSFSWYRKARGIREIYEMNQSQYLDAIFKLRDHRNVYVRREAQIALVVFLGWESLRYLLYLKRNIPLWQQIKIVEKLYDLHPKPEIKWLQNAYNSDNDYARKLVMRIIRKYQLHEEVDYIIQHLNHEDYEMRETAIYCIQTFAISTTQMNLVKDSYKKIPDATQQGQLLEYIHENSEIDLDFYLEELYGNNEDLKLKIAEILWNNGYKEKVQEFYYQQYPKSELNVG